MLERMHAVVQQAFGGSEVLEVAEVDRPVPLATEMLVEPDYPGLEALAGLVDSGQLRVHLQTTLPLAEAAKAHQLLESGRTTGKIALTI